MSEEKFPAVTSETTEDALRVRVSMAQAFVQMLLKAYDALLFHRVNYRDLPEYKDTTLLDEAAKLTPVHGQPRYIEWCKRVESGLRAAIARKSFRREK
jgi:hypothetical protein